MGRTITRILSGLLALGGVPSTARAQQLPPFVTLGGAWVESCGKSTDATYGLAADKPIQIGGGPVYMNARERRFLDALRGPDGQRLRVVGGIGSGPATINGSRTIVDSYTVTYEGHDDPITLFMDAYHFGHPKVPKGFTCGEALPTALRLPPVDPFKATPAILGLAIEESAAPFQPVPLDVDGSSAHGVVFDQFRMMAFAARGARAAGRSLDPEKPPADARVGLVVLAQPASCEGRSVPAERVEIVGEQGPPLPSDGPLVTDASELSTLLPGVMIPPASVAARYRLAFLRPRDQIRIAYGSPCGGTTAAALLPMTLEPARLLTSAPARMPSGVSESDPTVYVQAVIDLDGRFKRRIPIGGPPSLTSAALQSLDDWRAQPARVNGVPVVTPIVLQIAVR
jgi:hypothetical protein